MLVSETTAESDDSQRPSFWALRASLTLEAVLEGEVTHPES